jgi:hypothetical protein
MPRQRPRKTLSSVDCVSAPYALDNVKSSVLQRAKRHLVEQTNFARLCFRAMEAQKHIVSMGQQWSNCQMGQQPVVTTGQQRSNCNSKFHNALQDILNWLQASSSAFPRRKMPGLMPAEHLVYVSQHPDLIKDGNVPSEIRNTTNDEKSFDAATYTYTEHEFYCAFEDGWWTRDTMFVDMVHQRASPDQLDACLQRSRYLFDRVLIDCVLNCVNVQRPLCAICMHRVLSIIVWLKDNMHSRFLSLLPGLSFVFGDIKMSKREQEPMDSWHNRCVDLLTHLSKWDPYIAYRHNRDPTTLSRLSLIASLSVNVSLPAIS